MIRKDQGTPKEDAIHVAKVAPFVFLIGLAILHLSGIMPSTQDRDKHHVEQAR